MSVMRKRIAEHMVLSRRTSAHVHSVFEVNFHRVAQIREAEESRIRESRREAHVSVLHPEGGRRRLKAVPVVNASIDGDNVVYTQDVNIGIAVALGLGSDRSGHQEGRRAAILSVSAERWPTSPPAHEISSSSRTRSRAARSRSRIQAYSARCSACRSSISRRSRSSASATIEKAARRHRRCDCDSTDGLPHLGYDHRLIDGAVADQFMSHVKQTLENWDQHRRAPRTG